MMTRAAQRSTAVGYVLYALSGVAVIAGAVVTFYAYITSGGNHRFPDGVDQQAAWWASSLGGLAASVLALRLAGAQVERGGRALRVLVLLALAIAAYGIWGLWLAELYRR